MKGFKSLVLEILVLIFWLGNVAVVQADRVDELFKQLKDKNWYVRREAAEALGEIRDTKAVESLISALKDENGWIRRIAAEILGRIGNPRAIEPLIAVLKDEDVRWVAAEALGRIGKPAVEPLISALKDNDGCVRWASAEALGRIGDNRAVEPLISALKIENENVQMRVVSGLVQIGEPAIEPLIATLKDRDSKMRELAAKALGEIGDSRAVEPLIALFKDEYCDVRKASAEALGKIGDSRAIPALLALQDWFTDSEVTGALDKFGWKPESVEDEVHYFVAKRDKDKLKQIWNKTKQVLLKDIESNEYRVIENVLSTFIGIGKEEIIQELIDTLNREGTKTMAKAYFHCGHKGLHDAAKDWTRRHYYIIMRKPGDLY